jgi:hypothetical protein
MSKQQNQAKATFKESELIGPVVKLLANYGYELVLAVEPSAGIQRGNEFGILMPQEAALRFVDVLGTRWGQRSLVDTLAVECKRARSVRESINWGLGQATDYQGYFHKVCIATEAGELHDDKREVLQILGLGHISVDAVNGQASFSLAPPDPISSRFNSSLHDRQVATRIVVLLAFHQAFQDVPGVLTYGETQAGGAWISKAVTENLQWTAWWNAKSEIAYSGINLERKEKDSVRVNPAGARRGHGEAAARVPHPRN